MVWVVIFNFMPTLTPRLVTIIFLQKFSFCKNSFSQDTINFSKKLSHKNAIKKVRGSFFTIFTLEFSGFESLESLESLARLLKKVSKSRETFKVRDFANTNPNSIPWLIMCKDNWIF